MRTHARDEQRPGPERPDGGRRLPGRAATPGALRPAGLRGTVGGVGQRARAAGRPSRMGPGWPAPPARPGPGRAVGLRRAGRAAGAADRLRRAVAGRRGPAGPARDGRGPAVAGHRPVRGDLAVLGPAPGRLGGEHVVVSAGRGELRRAVDPGRDRAVAARRAPGYLVPASRAGQPDLGAGRLGVRRVLRRDLRPGAELAVRRARGGPALRGGRGPARAAGPRPGGRRGWAGPCWAGWGCS